MSALTGLVAVATAAAATTSATTAVAAAATAATTLLARSGLVHGERAALEHGPVHRGDRRVGAVAHLHEAEAARPAGVAILDDLRPDHRAMLGELDPQVLLRRAEREVAHIQ